VGNIKIVIMLSRFNLTTRLFKKNLPLQMLSYRIITPIPSYQVIKSVMHFLQISSAQLG